MTTTKISPKKKSPIKASKNNASQNIDAYSEMTQWEHVRNKTDTYVGSDMAVEIEEHLLNYKDNPPGMEIGKIVIAEAVIRLFLEILSNAGDNVIRSREKKVDPGEIKVTFDGKWVTVENGGLCIPIKKKPGEQVYVSEKIFGQLMTSSNYDKNVPRLGAGTNGVGATCCLQRGTLVLMYDATARPIENVGVGDLLVDEHGNATAVTDTVSGADRLYAVSSNDGTYTVNGHHMLSLMMPTHKAINWNAEKNQWQVSFLCNAPELRIEDAWSPLGAITANCEECGADIPNNKMDQHYREFHTTSVCYSGPNTRDSRLAQAHLRKIIAGVSDNNIVDISVLDYLDLPDETKARLVGFRGCGVNYPPADVSIDPYILGLWLGDGDYSPSPSQLSTKTKFRDLWSIVRCAFSKTRYDVHNFERALCKYGLANGRKHVPNEYIRNSHAVRRNLLAGIIDVAGLVVDEQRIDIMLRKQPNLPQLQQDIAFVARSVGLECEVTIGNGADGDKIHVFSTKVADIPTKRNRVKNPAARRALFDQTGPVKVTLAGSGDFVGVQVAGPTRRFVLPDFTVTHNCNIFSTEFRTEIYNAGEQKQLIQTWRNMMLDVGPPDVREYTGPDNIIRVSYRLDFERFGLPGAYPKNTDRLFARFAGDFALSCKVPVYFNGVRIPFDNMLTYAQVNLQLDADADPICLEAKRGYDPSLPMASYEMLLVFTPDDAKGFSFVNGMMTRSGGVHVNSMWKAVAQPILEHMNKDADVKLTVQDVAQHFSYILNTYLPDPKFGSQSKSLLSHPVPAIRVPPAGVKRLLASGIVDRLESTVMEKQKRKSKLTDGKKKKHVVVGKGIDANDAGGPMSESCILEIVEGDSAEAYVRTMRGMMPTGHDKIGAYPMRGKFLNYAYFDGKVYSEKLNNNREYCDLKTLLGLRDGVDYSVAENRQGLRYGTIRYRTDADADGKHITGLLITLFGLRYPALVECGFVEQAYTPIKRAFKGKQRKSFLTEPEFQTWRAQSADHEGWKIKYFKGLGTSTHDDILEDIKNACNIRFTWDGAARDTIIKAFHPDQTNARKKWMSEAKNRLDLVSSEQMIGSAVPLRQTKSQSVSHFIDNEMIYYPLVSVIRAIPKLSDGLKESQRKLLWAAIVRWSSENNPASGFKRTFDEMKVAQFANYAAEFTNFHHNEDIMGNTTKSMAMTFPGARNMAYFAPRGQFGTRSLGGKDAASSRYLFTTLEWWIPFVFKPEDTPFLDIKQDEGQKIEPVSLFPIIPMCLVNGALGIATGFSTFVPNHNPLDIVQALLDKLDDKEPAELVPWYNGFQGKISIKTGTRKAMGLAEPADPESDIDNTNADTDTDTTEAERSWYDYGDLGYAASTNLFIARSTKRVMVTEGLARTNNKNNNIFIDELPLGLWNQQYYDYLVQLRERHSIQDFRETSAVDRATFEIYNARSLKPAQLRLTRTFGLNNMVLLGCNNFPVLFKDANAILAEFYKFRIKIYDRRKKYYVEEHAKRLDKFRDKKLIITSIVNKHIVVVNREEADVLADFRKLGVKEPDIYTAMSLRQFTVAALDKLAKQEEEIQKELDFYKNNTAKGLWRIDLLLFREKYMAHQQKLVA